MAKANVTCDICLIEITNDTKHIERHTLGNKHQRLLELILKKYILESWNFQWIKNNNTFVCLTCLEPMDNNLSFKRMKRHFKSQHQPFSSSTDHSVEIFKVFRKKKYYESSEYDFEEEKKNFKTIEGPVRMVDGFGNLLGWLKLNVFPVSEHSRFFAMASILEEHGKNINRGKSKGGSRMVMYGQYENFSCGWFIHPHESLYALSEIFIQEVSKWLQISFPDVMKTLDKNLENEGLLGGEGHFGNTPFTLFSVTRDYYCSPHDDDTDYGYGFIVWFYPDGKFEVEEQPSFWLPEYNVRCTPTAGATFLLNSKTTVHCTTRPVQVGVLGIALVQKMSFMLRLKKTLENPSSKIGLAYFKAKRTYEARRVRQSVYVVNF